MPFLGLKESIIGNFQQNLRTGDTAQLLRDLQTVQNVCKSCNNWAISHVFYLVCKFQIMDSFNPTKGNSSIKLFTIVTL